MKSSPCSLQRGKSPPSKMPPCGQNINKHKNKIILKKKTPKCWEYRSSSTHNAVCILINPSKVENIVKVKNAFREIPWWSSDSDSALSLPRTLVLSLVEELRSHKPRSLGGKKLYLVHWPPEHHSLRPARFKSAQNTYNSWQLGKTVQHKAYLTIRHVSTSCHWLNTG